MFDLVQLAMRRATEKFGSENGITFSAACFSSEFMAIVGLTGPLDGRVVEGMLCGRQDVEQLSGGSHYRMIQSR